MNHELLRNQPEKWKEAVAGFEPVNSFKDLSDNIGGYVRYLTRDTTNDVQGKLDFRLGGILVKVDPTERYIVLKNPRADRNQTWCVQTHQQRDGTPVINMWDSDHVKKYKKVISNGSYSEVVFWIRSHVDRSQEIVMKDVMEKLKTGEYKIIRTAQKM